MKIDQIRVSHFKMERIDPTWRTASYAASTVDGFILEIFAGGTVGIGGTAAHPNSISADDLELQLLGPVKEALVGKDPTLANAIRQKLVASNIHPRACLAADLALYDLIGKTANLPCHAFWGGPLRSKLKVVRMVGIKPPAELKTAVKALLEEGYTHLKIKIGTGLAEDIERIRELRETFGNDIWIAVDGNGAYTPAGAIELSRALEAYGVALIEQPIDYNDLNGLAEITQASRIPIMADQCVKGVTSALAVCQMKAAHVVSIKATSLGSLDDCRRVYEICRAFGVRVHFGGSVTSAIVDIAQAQLASSLPGLDEQCEVGEFMAVRGDPVKGMVIQDGQLEIGSGPGWGVTLDSIKI
jgi:L-Ala-D/L-Glu epimerase